MNRYAKAIGEEPALVCAALGIAKSDVVAFGDHLNDFPMPQFAANC